MSRRILVTGGARRLGKGISEFFLEKGWKVNVHYHRSSDGASRLDRDPGVNVHRADLTDPGEVKQLTSRLRELHDGLDLLVNNAAVFHRTPFEDLEWEQWRSHLDLNAGAPLLLVKELASLLRSREGSVVNILDAALASPYPDRLPYFASKGALDTLTRGLARRLAPEVRVNGVAPGPIELPEDADPSRRETLVHETPLNRMGRREDVARAVYFIGVKARFTTGSVLEVDGGRHLN